MALWMESDRMGHLLGAIDQAALDEQRGVVQNEKRQGENQPYGHNAVLVLAGDIDVATAKEKVARFFGDIPAGPSMAQPKVDVAKREKSTRETMTDKVPQARIYRAWNVAQTGTTDLDQLQLFAQVLGGAKSSRLDQRLLHQEKLVDNISAGAYSSQLGSNFVIMATVKQGVDPAKVEAIIDEEVRRLVKDGPTADELSRGKTAFRAGFIRGIERIGGFGGKADALAECTVFEGDPGCFRRSLATIDAATAADVRAVGAKWLGVGDHTLVVEPGARVALPELPSASPKPFTVPAVDPKFSTGPTVVDRSAGVPQTKTFPELKFPQLHRATLKNGTQVILAERHDIPVVQFSYEFPGGFTADQGRKSGTANFTMDLMGEGAGKLGALPFADAADALGATMGASASLDSASVYLSALKENLAPSLALYADMLRQPRFDQAEIDRVKATWIAGIQQEKVNPNASAMRVLPTLLYGAGHPYAIPFTGSGNEADIESLTTQRHARVAVRVAAPGQRAHPRRRRHHACGNHAASSTLRSVTGRRRRTAKGTKTLPRSPSSPRRACSSSTSRCAAVADPRRPARAADHRAERPGNPDDERRVRWRVHRAPQHEPAREQALGVRRVQLLPRCPRPAPVHALRTGADRQDRRVGEGTAQGSRRRHRQAPADDGGNREDQGQRRARPAGQLRNRQCGAFGAHQQRALRSSGRLRLHAQGPHRSADRRCGARRGDGDHQAEGADLGDRRRPVEDRAAGAQARPRPGVDRRRRRQAGEAAPPRRRLPRRPPMARSKAWR
jgi:predicted Zn-dependent peptidase